MTIIQLNPAIPLNTPKGEGIAHLVIDYGIENDLYWVVFIHDSHECWTFSNKEIRACKNITLGRYGIEQISEPKFDANLMNIMNGEARRAT